MGCKWWSWFGLELELVTSDPTLLHKVESNRKPLSIQSSAPPAHAGPLHLRAAACSQEVGRFKPCLTSALGIRVLSCLHHVHTFLPSFLPSFVCSCIIAFVRSFFLRSFIHSFSHSFKTHIVRRYIRYIHTYIHIYIHTCILHTCISYIHTYCAHMYTLAMQCRQIDREIHRYMDT